MKKQSHILAIDACTEQGVVALFIGGELRGQLVYREPKAHARLLAPMVRTLLQDMNINMQDVDASRLDFEIAISQKSSGLPLNAIIDVLDSGRSVLLGAVSMSAGDVTGVSDIYDGASGVKGTYDKLSESIGDIGDYLESISKIQDNFSVVKVSTGLDLYITQGNEVSLVIEADENLHDIIKTEVNENGKLSIYSEKNIWKAKAHKVHLTVTNIEELIATSGSDVYTENTIKAKNFKVSVTSGSDAKIGIDAENVTSSATSGADLNISGKAVSHTSSATSGSSIYAYELNSKNTTASATSGADIDIFASESIDARATSGGDIDYKGNPTNVNKKETSGGDVDAK